MEDTGDIETTELSPDPEKTPPFTVKIDNSQETPRTNYLLNHEFEFKHALMGLQNAGILDAFSKLVQTVDDDHELKGPSFAEIGYEQNPYLALYFDPQSFNAAGRKDGPEFWKSKGVRVSLLKDKSHRVEVYKSKWKAEGVRDDTISESGWVVELYEEEDILEKLLAAKESAAHYHDLRTKDENGNLTGQPERHPNAAEVVINNEDRSILLR